MSDKKMDRRNFIKLAGFGALGLSVPSYAFSQSDKRKEFVENAKKYLGTPYFLGGRLTEKNPGLDCMGLIFRAYSKTYQKPWTSLSVYPSEIINEGQLGKSVEGLDGVLKEDVDFSKFEEGDIIHLLSENSTQDNGSAKIFGKDYWTWHMGIYSNKKENLFLDSYPGRDVSENSFEEILKDYKAVFATRI